MNLAKAKILTDTRWANVELTADMVLEVEEDVARRWARQGIATIVDKNTKVNVFSLDALRIPKTDPVVDKDRKINDMLRDFVGDAKKSDVIADKLDKLMARLDGLEKENKELKKHIEEAKKK